MAVEEQDTAGPKLESRASQASPARRFLVGTNVVVATLFVAGIVVVAQLMAYSLPRRWDMTSTGVNSLSEASENVLRNLNQNIRLTSLYFETDREEKDQPRYRRAAQDLLDLYEATNRAKVGFEWINPLKDHEQFRKLLARLREKAAFKEEIEQYKAKIDRYTGELSDEMQAMVQSELDQMPATDAGARIDSRTSGGSSEQELIAPVEQLLTRWTGMLKTTRDRVDALAFRDNPQYTAAVNELKPLYHDFSKVLSNIAKYGQEQLLRNPDLSADYTAFLGDANDRYADLVASIEEETTALQELEPLKFDNLVGELEPIANAILVETDDEAMVVDFSSVWPPIQQGAGGRVGFKNRSFKGEEKLTSAILRATHKEQTAVIFVRYGGSPLFLGGFMPGQPPAPLATMKQQLEEANFIVEEWDVKSSDTPPEIDPVPTRTIHVVLKPAPPQSGPFGQPSNEPPFVESHRRAVLDAIGDDGRALFITGWYPGPFPSVHSTYEYNDYLSETWGIRVDTTALLFGTTSIAPGKYYPRRDFYHLQDLSVSDHDIVAGAAARRLALPWCVPLDLSDSPPEGVEQFSLVRLPARDGVWGVRNIQQYMEQLQHRQYLIREDADLEGPFELAVAATKGDAKTVVVSSREFATDRVAFASNWVLTSQGLAVRPRNPGNVTLLINSLHWLNDNTDFMNVGKPIETAVLQIESESTVRAVKVLTIFVWPMLALVCGCVVWWVRRR